MRKSRFTEVRIIGMIKEQEAQIIIESWRKHYNTKRPHSALGHRPPAPEAIIPMDQRPIMHQLLTWTTQVGPLTANRKWLSLLVLHMVLVA